MSTEDPLIQNRKRAQSMLTHVVDSLTQSHLLSSKSRAQNERKSRADSNYDNSLILGRMQLAGRRNAVFKESRSNIPGWIDIPNEVLDKNYFLASALFNKRRISVTARTKEEYHEQIAAHKARIAVLSKPRLRVQTVKADTRVEPATVEYSHETSRPALNPYSQNLLTSVPRRHSAPVSPRISRLERIFQRLTNAIMRLVSESQQVVSLSDMDKWVSEKIETDILSILIKHNNNIQQTFLQHPVSDTYAGGCPMTYGALGELQRLRTTSEWTCAKLHHLRKQIADRINDLVHPDDKK